MSGNAPPFVANQRVMSDGIVNRTASHRSVSDERVPTTGTSTQGRSSSNRSSTFGSLFRTRVDEVPQRPIQQNQHRPVSAYYPSHNSNHSFTSHPPISALPTNPSSHVSSVPGLPAPMPNPYQAAYQQNSYRIPQSAPNQQHNFNLLPQHPISAPAIYGSQPNVQQHHLHHHQQQQQQQFNGAYLPSQQQQTPLYGTHGSTHIPSPPVSSRAPPAPSQGDTDYEAVLQASKASAEEEERKRLEKEKEEEEHYMALYKSEVEERKKKEAEEEERMMMEALRASQLEDEESKKRRLERQKEEEDAAMILIEESRQSALREEEQRMQNEHAELLEQSRREAEEAEAARREALAEQERLEQAAVEESLRELEEEWRRRDEAERADAMHIQQGGEIGDVSYWQNLDEKKAHQLALEMNERFSREAPVAGQSSSNAANASSSTVRLAMRSRRRPLPPTPSMAAQAAGVEIPRIQVVDEQGRTTDKGDYVDDDWELSDDEFMTENRHTQEEGQDPFGDQAEAPPMYDEVQGDRPPEAPTSIPSNVQFARPQYGPRPDHDNTIRELSYPVDKSAAYSAATQGSRSVSQSPSARSSSAVIASTSKQPARMAEVANLPEISDQPASDGTSATGSSVKRLPDVPIDRPPIPVAKSNTERHNANSLALSQSQSTVSVEDTDHLSQQEVESVPTTPDGTVNFQQKAMKGTDFGYSSEPFGTSLYVQDLSEGKTTFPNIVTLRKCKTDGTLSDQNSFFVVRAPSWKALVRALAWYGNSRIEAGPEEVVDYPEGVPLRIEIEFVTPSKMIRPNENQLQKAHVSVCFSLAIPSLKEPSSSELIMSLKKASRALDSAYLRQGATRRVIALPSQAPKLPLDVVRLAQHMHRAHTFSAACPSTGATALHSPRDLHHAVERHDIGYVAKLQKRRKDKGLTNDSTTFEVQQVNSSINQTASESTSAPVASSSQLTADGGRRQSRILQPSNTSIMNQNVDSTNRIEEDAELEDEPDQNDGRGDSLDAGAVEMVNGDDRDSSRMARIRAHVHRRLGKRSGDPRLVDQDLESWITPFDMTQHG